MASKTKAELERERQTKLIKKLVVGLLITLLIVLAAGSTYMYVKFQNDKADAEVDDNYYAKQAAEDSKNYKGTYVYGGNYETFNALYNFVNKYFDYYSRGNTSIMYSACWDNSALESYGFTYSQEDYEAEMRMIAEQYHIYKSDEKHVTTSFNAVTYQNYTNFYLFTFNLQYTYYDSAGTMQSTPINEYTYTIFPYTNKNGEKYYKLLDFDVTDIGTQYTRFKALNSDDGEQLAPGLYEAK